MTKTIGKKWLTYSRCCKIYKKKIENFPSNTQSTIGGTKLWSLKQKPKFGRLPWEKVGSCIPNRKHYHTYLVSTPLWLDVLFSINTIKQNFSSNPSNKIWWDISIYKIFVYILAELCCASICKHKTDDKCYNQLGCNITTNF